GDLLDVYFDFWDGLAFWEERQSEAWSAFEFLGIGDLGGYLCCGASGGGLVRDLEFYWLCGAFDDSFGPYLSQISSCRRNCCKYGSFFSFSGCAEWCAGAGFSSAGCAAGWAVSVESSDAVWVSISGVSVQ